MKQLLAIIAIAATLTVSFSAAAQSTTPPAKVDTAIAIEKVPLLSYEIYAQMIDEVVGEIPAKYADEVRRKFTAKFQQLAAYYQQQRQKPAPTGNKK